MKRFLYLFFTTVIIFLFISCEKKDTQISTNIVTVNGESVTQAEIDYFKSKLKAEILNDYLEKYDIEYTEDFWQTKFDGKTPEEVLFEKALEESIMAKIQFVLMREEGIYEEITYESLYEKAELFNAENADKEGVVGIKSIKMSQFYSYYLQNGIMELKNIYAEGKLKPTEEEIEKKANEIKAQYKNDVAAQDYENIAKDKLKTEKYESYISQLRKNAEIKEVA